MSGRRPDGDAALIGWDGGRKPQFCVVPSRAGWESQWETWVGNVAPPALSVGTIKRHHFHSTKREVGREFGMRASEVRATLDATGRGESELRSHEGFEGTIARPSHLSPGHTGERFSARRALEDATADADDK